MTRHPVLRVDGLRTGYLRSPVVRDLSFDLGPGEVLSLIGPNGAGKTATLLSLSGFIGRSAGTVTVDGTVLPPGRPRRASRAGIAMIPDDRALFRALTVTENLRLAARSKGRVDEVFDLFPSLSERSRVNAGLLSGGEQQQLAIGRAMVREPRILMVDELSMGLAPVVVRDLLPAIRRVADETGTAVILVEQHFRLALEISDQAIVLSHGIEALRGGAMELRQDPALVEAAYFGTE